MIKAFLIYNMWVTIIYLFALWADKYTGEGLVNIPRFTLWMARANLILIAALCFFEVVRFTVWIILY